MHGILHPRPTLVRPLLTEDDVDLDALTRQFLGDARLAALAHFDQRRRDSSRPSNVLDGDCRTVQMSVPAAAGRICSGTIVAHVSAPAFSAWAALETGPRPQREGKVLEQLQLILQDLSDHDVHSCLALTETQCDVYDLDLVQLVAESLDRTTFARLRLGADIHWEGTLVRSLDPPTLVLVLSIDV